MKPIIKSPDIPALEKTEMGQLTGGFIEIKSIITTDASSSNKYCDNNGQCDKNTYCYNNYTCANNNYCYGDKPKPGGVQLSTCE